VITKGEDAGDPGYSAFEGHTEDGQRFPADLRGRGINHLYVGGLATDYCVKHSVLDAVSAGLQVTLLEDAIAGVDPHDSARAITEMRRSGTHVAAGSGLLTRGSNRWEHFAHGADVGIRGIGLTKEAAFEQIALALTSVITDLTSVRPEHAVPITCDAPTDDLLVVDWLNALVYEMATRRMLFSTFVVAIDNSHVQATAWGEPVNAIRHEPAVEVKGATYTALRVEQLADGKWLAQCVVDV
jgi:tRNA nucleotidyltransferase (CCA-adding enzyme)